MKREKLRARGAGHHKVVSVLDCRGEILFALNLKIVTIISSSSSSSSSS